MKIKESLGSRAFDRLNELIMLLIMVVTLYPFIHVIFASISDPVEVVRNNGLLLYPKGPLNIQAYIQVFKNPNIPLGYRNTLYYLVVGTALNMVMTCLAAYPLSRKRMMLNRGITLLVIFTMYFGGGLIPSYLLISTYLHMKNTIWAVTLPGAISTYNFIVLRTAMAGVPDSMEESARIDGANDYVILLRIIGPLVVPTLAVLLLFYGVGHWNSWFPASIYLTDTAMKPLQLVLRDILMANSTDSMATDMGGDKLPIGETIKFATIIIATVPVLFIYPFLQKYFVKGMMVGAVKG